MDKRRGSREYFECVNQFVEFASLSARDGKILCPCVKCVNLILQSLEISWGIGGYNEGYRMWEYSCARKPKSIWWFLWDVARFVPHAWNGTRTNGTRWKCTTQPAEGLNDDAKKFYNMILPTPPSKMFIILIFY